MSLWFGSNVGVHQLRRAVVETLQSWTELALVDLARGDGWTLTPDDPVALARRSTTDAEAVLERPRSWHVLADYRSPDRDQLPNVAVGVAQTVSGSRRAPRLDGRRGRRGEHDLVWRVNVATLVRGRGYAATAEVGGLYSTAVAVVLDQQLRRHALIDDVLVPEDGGEVYDGASDDESRTLALAVVSRDVMVAGARSQHPQALDAPEDPFEAAPPDPPEATSASTETSRS